MRRVSIAPPDRFGRRVVVPDVATDLSGQVRDRRKDAAAEQVAFNLRKPQLDLIEPGRIRRGDMQMHVRMLEQKRPHGLGLVGREVVGDDVDLPLLQLRGDYVAQEFDKGRTGMPGDGLPEDLARLRVERRQQRERAVPIVLKTVALGAPGDNGSTGSRQSNA